MKYEVGQKVKIKSLDWYNENKDEYGYVRCVDSLFTPEHSQYCGCEFTISHITEFRIPSYVMVSNGHEWTDEMIEGLVEEEVDLIPKFGEYSDNEPLDVLTITTEFVKEHGLPCPEGYIFKDENGNTINAQKIVLEKKGSKYPKTYEECSLINGCEGRISLSIIGKFTKLINARNAYWKLYGEEMRLGKPWEPDYDSLKTKYTIVVIENRVLKLHTLSQNHILIFPTEEMRDAFYENFKELIESVKELL